MLIDSTRNPEGQRWRATRPAACAAVFLVLAIWLLVWPYTGFGDSPLHFRSFVKGVEDPARLLTAWARPVYAAIMFLPALAGWTAVRLFTAALTTALVWQTMRMADDLQLRHATLAGLMVLWQPDAFALASDTMTEMPMALGVVIAIRLWWARRFAPSLLVVSFLPMVRPEGFFMIVLWGLLVLSSRDLAVPWTRRLSYGAWLGVGGVCWMMAGSIITYDPFFFLHSWSWPPGSYTSYGSGELLHYVRHWPRYCGPVLLPLFVFGVLPSLRGKMRLAWAVGAMVFVVHTVLWWRGWFASIGFVRILACISPVVALVCLYGWNLVGRWERWRNLPRFLRTICGTGVIVAGCLVPLIRYAADAGNYHYRLSEQAADWITARDALADAPAFFAGDERVFIMLDYPAFSPQQVATSFDHSVMQTRLANLPIGAVGVWDNYRSRYWFGLGIEDLVDLGFEVRFDVSQRIAPFSFPQGKPVVGGTFHRCVVVRKTHTVPYEHVDAAEARPGG